MPSVAFLATFDGSAALTLAPTDLTEAACSLQGLRAAFHARTGRDGYILHTGELERSQPGTPPSTVRLELTTPLTASPATYTPLAHARPWQRPGWFRTHVRWLEATLGEKVQRLEQVSSGDLGTVLRVHTAVRTTYLKTSEQGLEATLTAHITQAHPALTPQVVAWNQENLLLTEACGSRLSETADLELWRRAVDKLALFQRTADGAALRTLGCPEYPFEGLSKRASRFLKSERVLKGWGLNPEQIARVRAYLPAIVAAYERVAGLELPLLPAHGDAHPMNVLTGCDTVWFDWSEACIAHPLLDIGWFLAWLSHPGRHALPLRQQHPRAVDSLRESYLQRASLSGAGIRQADIVLLALMHRILV